jgi:sugar phosphate isomerase/epimerase
MGADPLAATRALGSAIYHVHAKDTRIESAKAAVNSLIDTKPVDQTRERSWSYVTLGYGHDLPWWREFCSLLRSVGYDDVLSIEHEDLMLPPLDGVRKSVDLLRRVIASDAKQSR